MTAINTVPTRSSKSARGKSAKRMRKTLPGESASKENEIPELARRIREIEARRAPLKINMLKASQRGDNARAEELYAEDEQLFDERFDLIERMAAIAPVTPMEFAELLRIFVWLHCHDDSWGGKFKPLEDNLMKYAGASGAEPAAVLPSQAMHGA